MENKWITYDDEEAEVELEIADLVFDRLVTETAELIVQIHDKKKHGNVSSVPNVNIFATPNIKKMNNRVGYSDITKIDADLNFNSV